MQAKTLFKKLKSTIGSRPRENDKTAKKKKNPIDYHLKIKKQFFKFTTGKKGELNISMYDSVDDKWKIFKKKLLEPRKGYFDETELYFLHALLIDHGALVFYTLKHPYALGAALFEDTAFAKIKWRTANPIYSAKEKTEFKKITKSGSEIKINLEIADEQKTLRFSLGYLFGNLFVPEEHQYFSTPKPVAPILERYEDNPIIQPLINQPWENFATFNAAAIYLDDKVHFLYRAIGNEGMSVLGYAASKNGTAINERLPDPVYAPKENFEFKRQDHIMMSFHYISGCGGWGGCEDPRISKIDDTLYMTYTAFNGTNPPGVALTAINVNDFLNKKWHWRKAVLISPPGEIHKNWVIFPGKINGKYAILHSLSPEIGIDYFDSLDFHEGDSIKSYHGQEIRNSWDNQMRGIGPPPIKTEDGWLILYHAMDKNDPGKYKLGVMLLDINNPVNVLYRSPYPILEPALDYENDGYKAGVIYCCGAVVINGRLFIYYGCADKSVAVASVNLEYFLKRLKTFQKIPIGLIITKNAKNK